MFFPKECSVIKQKKAMESEAFNVFNKIKFCRQSVLSRRYTKADTGQK